MISRTLWWYIAVAVLSLGIIFFLWRTVDEQGVASWTLTTQGADGFRKGMDIAGGVRLMYKIDLTTYRQVYTDPFEYAQVVKNVTTIILRNIDNRISWLGVSDYSSYIQTLSDGEYLVVEIGGVSDLEEAKEIIGKTVELEFKLQYEGDGSELRSTRQGMAEELLRQAVANPTLFAQLGWTRQSDNIFYIRHAGVPLTDLPVIYQTDLLDTLQEGRVHPVLLEGVYDEFAVSAGAVGWSAPQQTELAGWLIVKLDAITEDEETGETLYHLEEIFIDYVPEWVIAQDPQTNEILNGAYFQYANVSQSQLGQPVAVINFNDKWQEIFCNLTRVIVGQPLAIFIDGELITAPNIREPICGGSAQIDGQFDMAGARQLVEELNAGALPAQLILANEERVAPTLWDRAAQASVYIAIFALVAIAVFMFVMYGWRKSLSTVLTLVIFFIILAALIKLMWYALSLSGIAAVLLSIGMGIDANILIYERLREELRDGKPFAQAVQDAYERSWPAVRDGNITAWIIGLLLFFMWTNMFKGFGTMMMVTVMLTLFVIVPLTREFLLLIHDPYRETMSAKKPVRKT